MKMTHRLTDAIAYVDDNGEAGILHIVQAIMPDGVQLVGNGTCPRPLGVKLTGAYAVAPQLAKALSDALARLEAVDRALLASTGSRYECEIGEITRGRAILAKIGNEVLQPQSEPKAA